MCPSPALTPLGLSLGRGFSFRMWLFWPEAGIRYGPRKGSVWLMGTQAWRIPQAGSWCLRDLFQARLGAGDLANSGEQLHCSSSSWLLHNTRFLDGNTHQGESLAPEEVGSEEER